MKIKFFLAMAVLATVILCFSATASAQSSDEPDNWCHTFTKSLGYADSGNPEVGYLHTALEKEGFSYAPDTGNVYREGTAEAVKQFQLKYGIAPARGYFGISTRMKMNELYGCSCTPDWDCTEWSDCSNGIQRKTCTDLNNCGTTANKPSEVQVCQGPDKNCRFEQADGFTPGSNYQTTSDLCKASWLNWCPTYTGGKIYYNNELIHTCPGEEKVVTVFSAVNYSGYSQGYGVGSYTLTQMKAKGTSNNSISSVKVAPGYKVTFYGGDNFSGAVLVKTADDPTLANDRINSVYNWDDEVSSMKVEKVEVVCQENWDCTEWSTCSNGIQTQTCTDLNSCGTTAQKPAESQACGDKSINITLPASGAEWITNSTQTITWTSTDVSYVKIQIIDPNGTAYDQVVNKPSSAGTFTWTVNRNFSVGTGYAVRITDQNDSNTYATVPFSIVAQPQNNCRFVGTYNEDENLGISVYQASADACTSYFATKSRCGTWTGGRVFYNNELVYTCPGQELVVTVFSKTNYQGTAASYAVGSYTLAQMKTKGTKNDSISSVKVAPGYKVTLYRNNNFGGAVLVKTENDPTLVNDKVAGTKYTNWDDEASSMKVEKVEVVCQELWDCTEWSACLNSNQTRTCIDLNSCGTTVNKPAESQACQADATTYALTTTAVNGTISRSLNQATYDLGYQVVLTATANSGYRFVNWTGDATGTTNPITVVMDSNKSVTANFEADTAQPSITVTSPATDSNLQIGSRWAITWDSTGLPSNALLSIGINGDGQTSTMTGAQIATNVLASDKLYYWTVPSYLGESLAGKKYQVYATCLNCTTSVGNVGGYFTISAPDATTYALTTTATNGTITRSLNQTTYDAGYQVVLTATPNSGYHFLNWTGDATGTTNPITVVMDSNKSVTANFEINSTSGNPSVEITYPTLNETLEAGRTYTIRWNGENLTQILAIGLTTSDVSSFSILPNNIYSKDATGHTRGYKISDSLPGDQTTYSWTVPDDVTFRKYNKISILALPSAEIASDPYAAEVFDYSDTFLINSARIVCKSHWDCTEWSSCVNGFISRTCTDTNNCGTTTDKPEEARRCGTECPTNWNCTPWGPCANGEQKRTCTDSNNCGVDTEKPQETLSCLTSCAPNWDCTLWGACTSSRQRRTCTDLNSCGTNVSKPQEIQACARCIDSDGGKDYFTKGRVTISTSRSPVTDICYSAYNRITEYYCDSSGFVKSENHICPNGCDDGACLIEPLNQWCVDSDGEDYYKMGAVYMIYYRPESNSGAYPFYKDKCNGNTIMENVCATNQASGVQHSSTKSYVCPNGCSNGACIQGGQSYAPQSNQNILDFMAASLANIAAQLKQLLGI